MMFIFKINYLMKIYKTIGIISIMVFILSIGLIFYYKSLFVTRFDVISYNLEDLYNKLETT